MAYHLGANAAHILAARLQATDVWIREVLDRDEQIHRRELRDRYHDVFHPSFSTPGDTWDSAVTGETPVNRTQSSRRVRASDESQMLSKSYSQQTRCMVRE